ncbi:precorrin-6y C5,15-methyltransferase (decarboxylating) subunit CbiE [Pontibacter diazotrophicus]|uniref:Precorrin-6y C5,15-methyltransferase (Decarboxylating) subunit CbiE n=1 Tax=Pontibacter diazotrophicus TaxID=1400979 RepID=A0A3D8L1W0_9BACT|nr:precorrin-6y C5,15-methyltransferase (decarboxylating) subunit CbiE [Pontibacter diazotrophicus]RDV11343.1 precorrin-6y C5,15-methyltransferase (decarboxylating) subunit CbiE [Pontibacter diazotrophicus]
MNFHVIGIGNREFSLSQHLQDLISKGTLFSGGERHHALVKHLLPAEHQWIMIKAPLEAVFESYVKARQPVVVFASGDPFFYGFSNTLRNKFPAASIQTYPYFNSIQLLASRASISSNDLRTVSVHGRSWHALDEAVLKQDALIGVLTDQAHSPAAIAERMLGYGYSNYTMYVGEDLEGEQELVRHLPLEHAAREAFHILNCVILKKEIHRMIPFGIPDHLFEGLEGRPNMITKMPVRLCSLHALELDNKNVLWDIGFCTGSLSIEAKIRFPHLAVHAFEKRTECLQIMKQNQHKLGAMGITSYIGDIFEEDLSQPAAPDAVFVGGHGGRLEELLQKLNNYVVPGGNIVINAVQESSVSEFTATAKTLGWKLEEPLKLKVNSHNDITIMKAVKHT